MSRLLFLTVVLHGRFKVFSHFSILSSSIVAAFCASCDENALDTGLGRIASDTPVACRTAARLRRQTRIPPGSYTLASVLILTSHGRLR